MALGDSRPQCSEVPERLKLPQALFLFLSQSNMSCMSKTPPPIPPVVTECFVPQLEPKNVKPDRYEVTYFRTDI